MSKKKMNLEKLEIKSFVTDADKENMETIKGGYGTMFPSDICSPLCAYTEVSCNFHCNDYPYTVKTL